MITDQPGRLAAVVIIAPLLCASGLSLRITDKYRKRIGTFIVWFAAVLFFYEMFWITCKRPKACQLTTTPHGR